MPNNETWFGIEYPPFIIEVFSKNDIIHDFRCEVYNYENTTKLKVNLNDLKELEKAIIELNKIIEQNKID